MKTTLLTLLFWAAAVSAPAAESRPAKGFIDSCDMNKADLSERQGGGSRGRVALRGQRGEVRPDSNGCGCRDDLPQGRDGGPPDEAGSRRRRLEADAALAARGQRQDHRQTVGLTRECCRRHSTPAQEARPQVSGAGCNLP